MVARAWAEPSDLGSQRGMFIDSIFIRILWCSVRVTPSRAASHQFAVRPNTQNAESGYACKAETWVGSIVYLFHVGKIEGWKSEIKVTDLFTYVCSKKSDGPDVTRFTISEHGYMYIYYDNLYSGPHPSGFPEGLFPGLAVFSKQRHVSKKYAPSFPGVGAGCALFKLQPIQTPGIKQRPPYEEARLGQIRAIMTSLTINPEKIAYLGGPSWQKS